MGVKQGSRAGCVVLEFKLWTWEKELRDTVEKLQERRQSRRAAKPFGYLGWISVVLGAFSVQHPNKETMEHYQDQVSHQISDFDVLESAICHQGKPTEQSSGLIVN